MERIALIVSGYHKGILEDMATVIEGLEKTNKVVFLVENHVKEVNLAWGFDSCLLRLTFDDLVWSPTGTMPEILHDKAKQGWNFSTNKSKWKQKSIEFKRFKPKFNRKMLKK